MKELTRRCLAISKEARMRLIKVLTESLDEKESGDERFEELYKIVTDMVGNGLLTSSRNTNLVIGRCLIAYQMRQERYALKAIGKCLMKDHSSVSYMCKRMEEAMNYPNIYQLEMGYWEDFKRRLDESKAV